MIGGLLEGLLDRFVPAWARYLGLAIAVGGLTWSVADWRHKAQERDAIAAALEAYKLQDQADTDRANAQIGIDSSILQTFTTTDLATIETVDTVRRAIDHAPLNVPAAAPGASCADPLDDPVWVQLYNRAADPAAGDTGSSSTDELPRGREGSPREPGEATADLVEPPDR